MTELPHLTLNDGHSMPQLGFGIWGIAPETTAQAVENALRLGYRLIDGAYLYHNETELGAGLRQSGVARDDVFITTKVWNNEHGRDRARASVKRSLAAIGIDQLDLVLIHWPVPEQDLYLETWEAFIEMRDEGLMRSIGVSNFNADHLDRIISATGVTPAVNQIEVNPELAQPVMLAANTARGIVTQAWTPLGNGRSFELAPITEIAARTGKSPAQVVLRWHLQRGVAPLSRSIRPARQAENMALFDFALTEAEMAAMQALDIGKRTGPDPSVFKAM